MRILALDTSTEWCSVAAGDGTYWHQREERAGQSHAERALVLVAEVLADAGWTLRGVDGIAFGAGPGSFTGVRIACGLAQGLALGADRPLVPVPTLTALAHAAAGADGATRVVACLDARMREVYVSLVERRDGVWTEVEPPRVARPDALRPPPGDVWFGAGNGFAAYPDLAKHLGLARFEALARPTARAVGELASPSLAAGNTVTAASALPLYVRHRVALTTAERAAGARL